MAFDAQKMQAFSERTRNFITNLEAAYIEAGRLDDIYTNEAESGSDPAWGDTSIATAAEHVDAVLVMRRLRDALAFDGQTQNLTAEDQTARFTPFMQ